MLIVSNNITGLHALYFVEHSLRQALILRHFKFEDIFVLFVGQTGVFKIGEEEEIWEDQER